MENYKKYILQEPAGGGAYGIVYKAKDLNGNLVALKKVKVESEEEGIPTTSLREITVLRHLNHENIVQLLDVLLEPSRISLIFEWVDMDLKKYIDRYPSYLPQNLIHSFTSQLFNGIAYCHSMGVIHRDLKPQNILVNQVGGLKIADFGLARCFTPHMRPLTTSVVTRYYRSPELLLGSHSYDGGVDMWSAGCILLEMSNKFPPFQSDCDVGLIHSIFRSLGTPSEHIWPNLSSLPHWRPSFPQWPPRHIQSLAPLLSDLARDLLSKIFVYDPLHRISAHQSLSHPYISQPPSNPITPLSSFTPTSQPISAPPLSSNSVQNIDFEASLPQPPILQIQQSSSEASQLDNSTPPEEGTKPDCTSVPVENRRKKRAGTKSDDFGSELSTNDEAEERGPRGGGKSSRQSSTSTTQRRRSTRKQALLDNSEQK